MRTDLGELLSSAGAGAWVLNTRVNLRMKKMTLITRAKVRRRVLSTRMARWTRTSRPARRRPRAGS